MITATIFGRLTKDPEEKQVGENNLVTFSVASPNPTRKDQEPTATFVNVTAWGAKGVPIANNFKKGDQICVSGDLYMRSYETSDGIGKSLDLNMYTFSFVSSKSAEEVEPEPKKAAVKATVKAKPVTVPAEYDPFAEE